MSDLYIGILSGTSIDGVDVGLWDIHQKGMTLIKAINHPFPTDLKDRLLSISFDGICSLDEFGTLDRQVGHLFAEAVQTLVAQCQITSEQIKAIGSHGQAIWHKPTGPNGFTIQIGDPNTIAQRTGICTIADFRRADIALGGQGAPLVPLLHHKLFHHAQYNRVILNIGGIANISILPKEGVATSGYDTGPGNGLMDAWIKHHLGLPFDAQGEWANQGTPIPWLLEDMLSCPYFSRPYPKSTGKDLFNLEWINQFIKDKSIKPADIQATLLELTATTIANAILTHGDCFEIYLCGGGLHNTALTQSLAKKLNKCELFPLDRLGIDADWMESALFAWLAKMRLECTPLSLTHITGSLHPVILGGIYLSSINTNLCMER